MPIAKVMIIVLYKTGKNGKSRYYTMHDRQGNLFSPHVLTILWGGAPNSGREKEYIFSSAAKKERKIREIMRKRSSSGYKVLYRFVRNTKVPIPGTEGFSTPIQGDPGSFPGAVGRNENGELGESTGPGKVMNL